MVFIHFLHQSPTIVLASCLPGPFNGNLFIFFSDLNGVVCSCPHHGPLCHHLTSPDGWLGAWDSIRAQRGVCLWAIPSHSSHSVLHIQSGARGLKGCYNQNSLLTACFILFYFWKNSRQTDPWSRRQSPEIDPNTHTGIWYIKRFKKRWIIYNCIRTPA